MPRREFLNRESEVRILPGALYFAPQRAAAGMITVPSFAWRETAEVVSRNAMGFKADFG
jgi:hypothetical protein